MKRLYSLLALAGVLFMTSCGVSREATLFNPDNIQLELTMDDLAYLGSAEISVSYDVYLGIITKIREVNGKAYNSFDKKSVDMNGIFFNIDPGLSEAAVKVLEDYPEANYCQTVIKTTTTHKLFLGKEVEKTAIIRAYKFK